MKRGKRNERLEVTMTEAEALEVRTAAESEGLSVATFMRLAALRLARQ
jgi:uncharacterized protein (DUF1778 family)